MGTNLDALIGHLTSVVKELKAIEEAEEVDLAKEEFVFELLADIEDLFQMFDEWK